MNTNNFIPVNNSLTENYEMYKFMPNGKIKALTSENIELILDPYTGNVEKYLNLQYKFQNQSESFYDNRSG